MDKHSEMEVKFRADGVTVEDVNAIFDMVDVSSYKKVGGYDRYYTQGDNIVRHRCDGLKKTSILTVKSRKQAESITDRHEIDMPIGLNVPEEDVTAFLAMTGWKLDFEIYKMSYIWHLHSENYSVCIALYDVWPEKAVLGQRYLEVEIEKDSVCTDEQGLEYLAEWQEVFQFSLDLDNPLNKSLYELYSPKMTAH